jgi:hypothetical protein
VIQGDITKCFDRIPHEIVIKCLGEHIADPGFLGLIKKFLKTGYRNPKTDEQIKVNKIGIPQGGTLSPVLSNIVLHKLDEFMQDYIKKYEKGKRRKGNPTYKALEYRRRKAKTREERIQYLKQMRNTTAYDVMDPNFKRMLYIRYADDFVVLITGTKQEAELTKIRIKDALLKRCGAELSEEKTIITHMKEGFEFLGTQIRKASRNPEFIRREGRKNINKVAVKRLIMNAPLQKILCHLEKAGIIRRKEQHIWRPTGCKWMNNLTHYDIIKLYNYKIQGILNFYRFASNYARLGTII